MSHKNAVELKCKPSYHVTLPLRHYILKMKVRGRAKIQKDTQILHQEQEGDSRIQQQQIAT